MTDPMTSTPCGLPKYALEVVRAACDEATRRYDTPTVEAMAERVVEVLGPVFEGLAEMIGPYLCNVPSRADRVGIASLLGIDPTDFDYGDTDE